MSPDVRALEQPDAEAAHALRHEAFGNPRSQGQALLPKHRQNFGAFASPGGLIGCLGVISDASYFGGQAIPSVGISGVTVAAEHRGRGALTPLFDTALRYALDQGAVLATLFPTANGIYRRLGFEIITDLVAVSIPMAPLGSLTAPADVTLQRAAPADAAAIRGLYDDWAREHNGPLARTGPLFRRSDEALVQDSSAVTLALRDGQVTGFARWDRSPGYGDFAHVEVRELVAADRDSSIALVAMLATFSPVAGELRLPSSGLDGLRTALPGLDWTVTRRNPYMLRVLDVARAFTRRGWPPIETSVRFGVHDDRISGNTGVWSIALDGGYSTCERESDVVNAVDVPCFTAAGLAMAYSGAWPCASIRRTGQLGGGSESDALLDVAFGGRQTHIRDYF